MSVWSFLFPFFPNPPLGVKILVMHAPFHHLDLSPPLILVVRALIMYPSGFQGSFVKTRGDRGSWQVRWSTCTIVRRRRRTAPRRGLSRPANLLTLLPSAPRTRTFAPPCYVGSIRTGTCSLSPAPYQHHRPRLEHSTSHLLSICIIQLLVVMKRA